MEKINYTDEADRQKIISEKEAEGLICVRDHIGHDGINFMQFSKKPRDIEKELDDLKAIIKKLEQNNG
jgi:hypothetical protein